MFYGKLTRMTTPKKNCKLNFLYSIFDFFINYEKKKNNLQTFVFTSLACSLVATAPLKGKLTVSTRFSKLNSRVAKVETFEFREARIESREMRSSGIFMNSNLCEN